MLHRLQAFTADRIASWRHELSRAVATAVLLCGAMQASVARGEDGLPDFSDFELRLGQDQVLREAAEARLKLAKAQLYPKVAIGSDMVLTGRIDYSPDVTKAAPNSYAKRDPTSLGLEVSWTLFNGLRNLNDIAAAKESLSSTAQASLDTRQKLLLEKADKVLSVVSDRANVAAHGNSVQRYGKSYQIAGKLRAEEMMTVSQVALAGSELEAARALAAEAAGTLKSSELDYRKLTGRSPPARLALAPPEDKLPQTSAMAAARAQGNSPLLKMAFHLEKEAEYKAKSADGLRYPTLDLVGRYTRTLDPSPLVNRVDNYAVLLRLRLPIFDHTIQPTIDVARAEAAQRRYDRQDTMLSVSVEAKKLHEVFHALTKQVASLRRQVKQAETAATATRAEMETGIRTIAELLEAEQNLLTANIALAQARYTRSMSVFRLLAVMGTLEEADVGLDFLTF
jgi:outer membrane protein